ncbi:MAG: hypothetical protein ABIU86_12740 [Gemmatimonadaceae bacterium]
MTQSSLLSHYRTMLFALLLIGGSACTEERPEKRRDQGSSTETKKEKKHKKNKEQASEGRTGLPGTFEVAAADADDDSCDASLWKHVYNPSRLQVLDQCKVVTGVITELGADDDGDEHMLLKLDAGQESLINKKNVKKKQGNLVIEVVCAAKVTLATAVQSCRGYRASIALPIVGQHVQVSGSYVIDSHNGWAELHPVSRIVAKK